MAGSPGPFGVTLPRANAVCVAPYFQHKHSAALASMTPCLSAMEGWICDDRAHPSALDHRPSLLLLCCCSFSPFSGFLGLKVLRPVIQALP